MKLSLRNRYLLLKFRIISDTLCRWFGHRMQSEGYFDNAEGKAVEVIYCSRCFHHTHVIYS